MLRLENAIFSFDILEKKFRCNLQKCRGNCCRYGDSGAPLSAQEVTTLAEIYPVVKEYLRPEGIAAIGEKGTSVVDFENDNVTPLIGDEECAYAIIKDNIYMCGIEKAWSDGRISYKKPVSCDLFPVRIKYYTGFMAVNYQELPICSDARVLGAREGIHVYRFLKEPLTRVLGRKMYDELCQAAQELRRTGQIK